VRLRLDELGFASSSAGDTRRLVSEARPLRRASRQPSPP
jgi:hypothetical protein